MSTLHPSLAQRPLTGTTSSPMTPDAADRGHRMYQNPVLYADYSDPDAIRVGDDYWLTASSFCQVPGLPILHSRDLVNWTLVNHALPRLQPLDHFAVPRHGAGVWAPALRHHAGKFWLFYPDPDFGLYVVTADDPRGFWSDPIRVKEGKGLIDPCPFWDDDGTGYLIHGWAKSRSGIKNRLTLHRLSEDNTRVIDAGEVVIDGDAMEGWHTIEGPKLYKRAGYYYIFAPAGGVRDGYQAVFRSRSLRGPYEHRIVLAQGTTAINGPHQGAWVDTAAGEHWFLHFQERSAFGRVVHLQPMTWHDDWPAIGQPIADNKPGEPVSTWPMPRVTGKRPAILNGNNDGGAVPGREWQWQANPQPGWFSLLTDSTTWRLPCIALPRHATLWNAGHLLLQKFIGPGFMATAALRLRDAADGDRAGLVIFGHDYAWLGWRCDSATMRFELNVCVDAHRGGVERPAAMIETGDHLIHVRVEVDEAACCRFSFSRDGKMFEPIGSPFHAKSSDWVGAKVGIFAASSADAPGRRSGCAEISHFDFRPLEAPVISTLKSKP